MSDNLNRPRVGVGVMILKDGKALFGKRLDSHGAGEWCSPGGHMEYMESFEQCAKRETMEEAGIEIENVRFLNLINLKDYPPKHYVHITLVADWKSGEPRVMEPHKIAEWQWFDLNNPPNPLFATAPKYFEALKTG